MENIEEIMELWDRHPELHSRILQLLKEHKPDPEATPEPPHTNE